MPVLDGFLKGVVVCLVLALFENAWPYTWWNKFNDGTFMSFRSQAYMEHSHLSRGFPRFGVPLAFVKLDAQMLHKDPVPDRMIIAAIGQEDVSWLYQGALENIPKKVYHALDSPFGLFSTGHHRPAMNRGNEAGSYLQFIIDHYDRLPRTMVFIHGHLSSWHMENKLDVLSRLRWDKRGFANLRYAPGTRLAWTCRERVGHNTPRKMPCNLVGPWLFPNGFEPLDIDTPYLAVSDDWNYSIMLRLAWPEIFESVLGPAPLIIRAPMSAEFLVTRDRVLRHPREHYLALQEWVIHGRWTSYQMGRMLEHTWHMLFGEAPVLDPVLECDLLHCTAQQDLAAQRAMRDYEDFLRKDWQSVVANLGDLGSMKPEALLSNLQDTACADTWGWMPSNRTWIEPQRWLRIEGGVMI
eukprot:jgi/Botrbrau1/16633/Bobra.0068s0052.1